MRTTLLVGLFDYEHMPERLPATRATALPWEVPHAVLLHCVSLDALPTKKKKKKKKKGMRMHGLKGGRVMWQGGGCVAVDACDQRPPAQQTLVVERSE